eukprot:7755798-Pyramimonas_sp.AAC.1
MLQWRRAMGRECAVCPAAIDAHPKYCLVSKAELEEQMQNATKREQFLATCRRPYITERNRLQGKRVAGAHAHKSTKCKT